MSFALAGGAIAGIGLTLVGVNKFLTTFGYPPLSELVLGSPKPTLEAENLAAAKKALAEGRLDELDKLFADRSLAGSKEMMLHITNQVLSKPGGLKSVAGQPSLAGAILGSADPAMLAKLDLDAEFGDQKQAILAEAMLSMSARPLQRKGEEPNRNTQCDPQLFTTLSKEVPVEAWNDTGPGSRGLGPRVCQSLWGSRNFDAICELIDLGVDTSIAARAKPGAVGRANGIYSGFVQPVQHIAAKHLPDSARLDDTVNPLPGWRKMPAAGAKKVLDKLGDKAVTLTDWDKVTSSEMIAAFKAKPGTIWGFEDIRMPYVQAGHDTPQGAQPLRMMEIWEAVEKALSPKDYERLLDDPDTVSDEYAKLGVDTIRAGLASSEVLVQLKYANVAKDPETFIKAFERDAKAFMMEFAAQLPKGMFSQASLDGSGKPRQKPVPSTNKVDDVPVSDVAGIGFDKLMSGLACKAGLWWAKESGDPLYYVLDGIDMADAINYKSVKNKAIEDYLTAGGVEGGGAAHHEVITLVEVREILKNWKDLKGTVVFVRKGAILKDEALEEEVAEWQEKMAEANKQAGRPAAPPLAAFTGELNKLDPGLIALLQDGVGTDKDLAKERDKDARDIVKKSGYLLKMAKTRPAIVLKYIESRCKVLQTYKLLSDLIPAAAKALAAAKADTLDVAMEMMRKAILASHESFRAPLQAALIR